MQHVYSDIAKTLHMPKPSAPWNGDVALPVRTLDARLSFVEVDVVPLERHHLAAPESGLAAGTFRVGLVGSSSHRHTLAIVFDEITPLKTIGA